ncbi:MAG: hypothetical protein ABI416_01415 [Ginsengibacter sp.]
MKFTEGDINEAYDWTTDVMSTVWDPKGVKKKIKQIHGTPVCDVLLDQQVFTGVGNIIKNEVLFRVRLHPETNIENIPIIKLNELLGEARNYSFDFLRWKKAFVLKKHWLANGKKICPRCNLPFIKKYCGKTKRRTFFCANCQLLYNNKLTNDKKTKPRRIPLVPAK